MMLSDGQTVLIDDEELGVISHRGSENTQGFLLG